MSYSDVHPNVFQACLEVKTGVSVRSAAEKYGISKSTLWNRTRSIIAKKAGRPKLFSDYDEHLLAALLRNFNIQSLPLSKAEFMKRACGLETTRLVTCLQVFGLIFKL